MDSSKLALFLPFGVSAFAVATGVAVSVEAGISALVGSLAVLLPSLWYTVTAEKVINSRVSDRIARLFRARIWYIATVIIFLAVGLRLLGEAIVAFAWLSAVVVQLLAPVPLLALISSSTNSNKD